MFTFKKVDADFAYEIIKELTKIFWAKGQLLGGSCNKMCFHFHCRKEEQETNWISWHCTWNPKPCSAYLGDCYLTLEWRLNLPDSW